MSQNFQIIVDESQARLRIDNVLAAAELSLSRTRIQKLCATGCVTVNNHAVKCNYRLVAGDLIAVEVPDVVDVCIAAEDIPLDIVYEDEWLAVLNKAAGMVVHPAVGHQSGTLVNALLARLDDISGIGGEMRPGIVHRLDKDTSGLMMVAKTDAVHHALSNAIAKRYVTRKYLAIVKGVISESEGIVRAPIGRNPDNRQKMAVVERGGKEAETGFVVRERFREFTLVECKLKTGRTHQIRVHMAYIGYPLLGDSLYGNARNRFDFTRQALHAYNLEFEHPVTHEHMSFTTQMPADMQAVVLKIRKLD